LVIKHREVYPDRKVEVRFRIGEKTEGTGGGQNFDPHLSAYPVPGLVIDIDNNGNPKLNPEGKVWNGN